MRSGYGHIAGIAAFTLGFVIFTGNRAVAQQGAVLAAGQSTSAPTTPLALLELLDWDPAQRGPLLIIAPDWVNASNGTSFFNYADVAPLDKPGPNGYRAANFFAHFSRKEMAAGGLSVAAPLNQFTLRYSDLPEPDLWHGVPPEERLNFLLATFTKHQWQQLLTQNGIGIGDLDRSQKGFFNALFPAGLQLLRTDISTDEKIPSKTTDITPTQPEGVRLRLFRRLKWKYLYQGVKYGTLSIGAAPQVSLDGKPAYWIKYPEEAPVTNELSASAYGVELMSMQPNRLKASDIDYELPALDFPVSVTGAKNVGDLIARLKAVTRLELYADIRMAELPVYFRTTGAMVRSGDLMKALALGVTGTYRRVSDGSSVAYVLTDDRVGLGTRQAIIGDWLRRAGLKISGVQAAVEKGLAQANASTTAPWANIPGKIPSDALQSKVLPDSDFGDDGEFPVNDLPEDIQTAIRNQTRDQNDRIRQENTPGNTLIRNDAVKVSSVLEYGFLLPSGEMVPISKDRYGVTTSMIGGPPYVPPKDTPNTTLRVSAKKAAERVLCVTVKTEVQAKQAAEVARAHGLNQIMLSCDISTNPASITEWVSAIKKAAPGLKVSLRVRPLWEPEEEAPREGVASPIYDLNLLGETSVQLVRRRKKETSLPGDDPSGLWNAKQGYWLCPGDKANTALVIQRVTAMMAVPGVSDLLLTDTLPPGYNFLEGEQQNVFDPEGHFGYTPSLRLTLIRSANVDPMDLSPYGQYIGQGYKGSSGPAPRIMMPFLPDYGPPYGNMAINGIPVSKMGAKDSYGRWNMMRYRQAATLRNQLAETVSLKSASSQVWTDSDWRQVSVVALPKGGLVTPIISWSETKANDALMPEVPNNAPGTAPVAQNYLIPFRYYDQQWLKDLGKHGFERFRQQAEVMLSSFQDNMQPPLPVNPALKVPVPAKPAQGFVIDLSDYPLDDVTEFLRNFYVVP